ncbi:MAG: ABC transporter permease [Chloroflexota bacterium]
MTAATPGAATPGGSTREAAPRRGAQAVIAGYTRRGGILVPFLLLFAILAFGSASFLRPENLANILDQQSATIIVAVAGTLVLIAGGIDLSVGAIYALAAVTSGSIAQQGGPVWLAVIGGCAVGLAVGIVNGVVVTRFRINSLIATLAASFVVGGLAALVTQGNLVVAFERTDFQAVAATKLAGLTGAAWIMIAFAVIVGIVLARSAFGRYVYATGGNAEAARLGGVSVDRIKLATFALSGFAAGLAGTLDTSRVLSAQANSGTFLAFTVLAGIVVGGTSIQGGEGAVWKSVVGCMLIALIGNGFNLLGLDPFYRQITLGLILILAVGLDAWSRKAER